VQALQQLCLRSSTLLCLTVTRPRGSPGEFTPCMDPCTMALPRTGVPLLAPSGTAKPCPVPPCPRSGVSKRDAVPGLMLRAPFADLLQREQGARAAMGVDDGETPCACFAKHPQVWLTLSCHPPPQEPPHRHQPALGAGWVLPAAPAGSS